MDRSYIIWCVCLWTRPLGPTTWAGHCMWWSTKQCNVYTIIIFFITIRINITIWGTWCSRCTKNYATNFKSSKQSDDLISVDGLLVRIFSDWLTAAVRLVVRRLSDGLLTTLVIFRQVTPAPPKTSVQPIRLSQKIEAGHAFWLIGNRKMAQLYDEGGLGIGGIVGYVGEAAVAVGRQEILGSRHNFSSVVGLKGKEPRWT